MDTITARSAPQLGEGRRDMYDLTAFIAAPFFGVVLISLAHPSSVLVGAWGTAVSGCYAAWRLRR